LLENRYLKFDEIGRACKFKFLMNTASSPFFRYKSVRIAEETRKINQTEVPKSEIKFIPNMLTNLEIQEKIFFFFALKV